MPPTKITLVLPIRDRQDEVVARIERILAGLQQLPDTIAELMVVDDGSRDATPERLDELQVKHPLIRIARHPRPRGMEAAGQTGLERATGELVLIQESDSELLIEDVRRLLMIATDPSVVAARAESRLEPIAVSLLRRLRQWGTDSESQVEPNSERSDGVIKTSALQLIRRPVLQQLTVSRPDQASRPRPALEGQVTRLRTVHRASGPLYD